MIGPHGENLAYVLGVPRSGTTLLCALLANHPDAIAPPESWLMLALESFGRASPAHPADSRLLAAAIRETLDEDTEREAARAYAQTVYNRKLERAGRRVFVDKTPRYYHILEYIHALFPAARFVWIQRNPLDVAASYKSSWGVRLPGLIEADPGHPAALDLLAGLPRLRAFAEKHPEHVVTLRYEDLVSDPDGAIGPVLRFLGLPPAADLLDLDAGLADRRTATMGDRKILETRTIHRRSVGSAMTTWSRSELQTLVDAMGFAHVADAAGPEVVAELRARGIEDRGSDVTRRIAEQAEQRLAERWHDVRSPDEATQQLATRVNELECELLALQARHQTLQADAGEAVAAFRGAQDRSPAQQVKAYARETARAALGLSMPAKRRAWWPTLSIITPVVSPTTALHATLESVRRQSYPALEHLLVLAEGVDLPPEIWSRGDVRVLHLKEGEGRIPAINLGLLSATGEAMCWLDPGETIEPGALQRAGRYLRRHPRIKALYFRGAWERHGWRFVEPARRHSDVFSALSGEGFPRGGVLVNRSAFQVLRTLDASDPFAAEEKAWLAFTRWFAARRGPGLFRTRHLLEPGPAPSLTRARDEFRQTMRWIGLARRWPRSLWRRLAFALRRRPRLLYPHAWADELPLWTPAEVLAKIADRPSAPIPHCPISGGVTRGLVMTVGDRRFDPPVLREILRGRRGVAFAWPPIAPAPARAPAGDASAVDAPAGVISPFAGVRPRRWRDAVSTRWPVSLSHDEVVHRRARIVQQALAARLSGARDRASLHVGASPAPARGSWDVLAPGVVTPAATWDGRANDAPYLFPPGTSYGLIHVDVDADLDPAGPASLRRLSFLLAPGGVLLAHLPNLDSAQRRRFGPTWAPWSDGHVLFLGRRTTRALARMLELDLLARESWCDPETTARSLRLSASGLGTRLTTTYEPPPALAEEAGRICSAQRCLADWRGRGDYLSLMFRRPPSF